MGVERFDADGMAIRLVVKTRPLVQWRVARELRARIKRAFGAEKASRSPSRALAP